MKNEKEIFLDKGNTPSSKNGKRMFGPRLIQSKATMEWKRDTAQFWEDNRDRFKEQIKGLPKPIRLGVHFCRKSRHKFDWINMCQVVFDQMTKSGWIDDDNCDELVPYPLMIDGNDYTHDKENPSTIFKVLSEKDTNELHEILNINTNERDN